MLGTEQNRCSRWYPHGSPGSCLYSYPRSPTPLEGATAKGTPSKAGGHGSWAPREKLWALLLSLLLNGLTSFNKHSARSPVLEAVAQKWVWQPSPIPGFPELSAL